MRAGDALAAAAARLSAAGIDGARREARLLLAEASGLTTAALLDPGRDVDAAPFEALVARRAAREPMALVLGWQEFWSLRLAVSRDTLIPRADSETLIEAAVAEARDVRRVLDLGVGTGCLLLAALSEFGAAWGAGLDRSAGAVRLAQANARRLDLHGRASFVVGDWAGGIGLGPAGGFELILCNPPYIATADLAGLMPEVADHEPARALDGGPDGLDAYRALLPTVGRLLAPAGVAIFELGQGQAAAVSGLAERAGLQVRSVRADLAGIPRAIVMARKSGIAARPRPR